MHQYYNIHTHKLSVNNTDCHSIYNIYQNFDAALPSSPCSIGIHPCHLDDPETDFAQVQASAKLSPVLAIGECGLDKLSAFPLQLQTEVFIKHIILANEVQKPLIIHCVRAHDEVLNILDKYAPKVPVIFHGFNKKISVAERLIHNGYFLSFGDAICNDGSPAALALRIIPPEKFFLETDDSDVSIEEIYAKAAQIRKTTTEAIILQIQQNYKNVFPQ